MGAFRICSNLPPFGIHLATEEELLQRKNQICSIYYPVLHLCRIPHSGVVARGRL